MLDKMIQNDILRKIGSGPGTKYIFIDDNFVAHRMQNDNNAGKWKSMNRLAWCGPLLCSLQTALPTLIVVIFGAYVVNFILKVIPEWVTDGLSIAAGILPVVGIGMLMRYMPIKKFLPFVLIGFVLSAYLSVPVLGIAIVGFVAAFWYFTSELKKANAPAATAVAGAGTYEAEGDDFDEYLHRWVTDMISQITKI